MHEVLVNRLGGLSLPRKSVVRFIDRPDVTLHVYRGRKTTTQQQQIFFSEGSQQEFEVTKSIPRFTKPQNVTGSCLSACALSQNRAKPETHHFHLQRRRRRRKRNTCFVSDSRRGDKSARKCGGLIVQKVCLNN